MMQAFLLPFYRHWLYICGLGGLFNRNNAQIYNLESTTPRPHHLDLTYQANFDSWLSLPCNNLDWAGVLYICFKLEIIRKRDSA